MENLNTCYLEIDWNILMITRNLFYM